MQLQQDIERDIKAVKSLIAKLKRRLTLLTVEEENEYKDEKVTDIPTAEQDDDEDELVREVKRAYKVHKAELTRLEARKKEVETSFDAVLATGLPDQARRGRALRAGAPPAWRSRPRPRVDLRHVADQGGWHAR